MKKSILVLSAMGIVALASVANAQNNGTTTTSVNCGAAATSCTVQGQTLLQAVKVEGLTLTVPNEIDFTIVDGQLALGNKPLTAATTWDLAAYGASYTNIDVDAWFPSTTAMTATDGSGATIAAANIVGQIGNNGPQMAFGTAAAYNSGVVSTNAFPIYSVPPTTNSIAAGAGNYSIDLNLYVDSRTATFPVLGAGAVYSGYVYVTAAAI